MQFRSAIIAACLILAFASAPAAEPPPGEPIRVRGQVASLDGDVLTVRTRTGESVPVTLLPDAGVTALAKKTPADIVDGVFIGTTALRGEDGRWKATEVHIFPEEMRGAGEGHYPWDLPESTMTNATVMGKAARQDGTTMHLTHKDGETEVDIVPETIVVAFVPGDRSLLVPGATVFVIGMQLPDGAINAFGVTAEKDGVKPPM